MNRRSFMSIAGTSIMVSGIIYYFSTDTNNFVRGNISQDSIIKIPLEIDERAILTLASLSPSGHNTQPWLIKYKEPYHWVICIDKNRWLPAVDPTQRESILSIGAFLQNLEFAAQHYGYAFEFKQLALSNQDEEVVEVRLTNSKNEPKFEIQKLIHRRTVRSNYLDYTLKNEDLKFLTNQDIDFIHYIPNSAKEHQWLNEQTIEANRIQAYREDAEKELAEWIRFSNKDAKTHCDGLTLASMEIEGITAWYLRNFYEKADVMKNSFREQSIDKVVKQVSQSAGWLLITSKDNSVETLLETGKRFQRLLLKIRERNIAIHPMTQILEETSSSQILHSAIGTNENVQFILRTGYIKNYPQPVSLRRPVDWFVRT